jgi:hypothetical protein
MAAGKYSFTIEQGTTVTFAVQYLDSTSSPIDLTGYDARMQIRSDFADNKNVLYLTLSSSLDSDGSGIIFGGLDGLDPLISGSMGIYISADKTTSMSFSEALYDLELYSGSFVTRILEGSIFINKEVTRY